MHERKVAEWSGIHWDRTRMNAAFTILSAIPSYETECMRFTKSSCSVALIHNERRASKKANEVWQSKKSNLGFLHRTKLKRLWKSLWRHDCICIIKRVCVREECFRFHVFRAVIELHTRLCSYTRNTEEAIQITWQHRKWVGGEVIVQWRQWAV